nr:TetR/AcrR family transcriptional regulator [Nocardia nova]
MYGGAAHLDTPGALSAEGRRRTEILDTASQLFASSGLRTSLQEIANACNIKPQSLYHHFASKEAIVVALVQRYHDDLDRIAEDALRDRKAAGSRFSLENIVLLGRAIAECAVRHSAAVQFTFYEPPAGAGLELVQLVNRRSSSVEFAVLEALRAGRSGGFIRPGVDLTAAADRMCQTMLHVGVYLFHEYSETEKVAGMLCTILLFGLATDPPDGATLDRTDALLAVDHVIETWDEAGDDEPGSREALIKQVARAEFGRVGYETTTIRNIAAAAGMSVAGVYRVVGSKDELMESIMSSFTKKTMAGWQAVLTSKSSALEKLDALMWLHVNVVDRFNDEFKIQLTWMRQSPPQATNPGLSFPAVLQQLRNLLTDGVASGDMRVEDPAGELTARCVLELTWIPETIVRTGKRAALAHARDILLRGIAAR